MAGVLNLVNSGVTRNPLQVGVTRKLTIPILNHNTQTFQTQGSLIFDPLDRSFYVSDGTQWERVVSVPTLGADAGVEDVTAVRMDEKATVPGGAPAAGLGTLWVRSDAPNNLIFTDDDGVDHVLAGAAVIDTLMEVLANGNTTGGTDIEVSIGDAIVAPGVLPLSATGVFNLTSVAVAGDSTVTHAGAAGSDLLISSPAGSVGVTGGEAIADAVNISAPAGGVDIVGGLAAVDAVDIDAPAGGVSITGGLAAADAIDIDAPAGGVSITAGLAAVDAIDIDAPSGGITIDAAGGLSLDSASAAVPSNFTSVGAAGVDLTVSCTAGSVIVDGGEAAIDAVRVFASDAAGGIDIDSGTGGIAVDTTGGLSLDSTSVATASNLTTVGAAGVDLTVSSTAGSVIVIGGEAATDAVQINASAGAGGVDVQVAGTSKLAIVAASATLGDGVKLVVDVAGGNAVAGTAVLVGGTVTIATTSVAAGSLIFLTRVINGGAAGFLVADTIVAATSFDINSASGTDTSTVNWLVIN